MIEQIIVAEKYFFLQFASVKNVWMQKKFNFNINYLVLWGGC